VTAPARPPRGHEGDGRGGDEGSGRKGEEDEKKRKELAREEV